MSTTSTLSRYQPGSFLELYTITWPLILSSLSGCLMHFIDRLILANYSTLAMTSAAAASMAVMLFMFSANSIASIAEVFVGQHHGAERHAQVAKPVWQMIGFSLSLNVLFIPLAFCGGSYLVPSNLLEQGLPYYQWSMAFACLLPVMGALTAFFAGTGQTRIIMLAAIIGNVANLFLDVLLVFGYTDVIAPMGTQGAAIATVASLLIQNIILGSVFLSSHHRKLYKTHQPVFCWQTFKQCLRVGYPNAISHGTEMAAWTALFHVAAAVSINHATIQALGQSVFIFIAFMTEGLQKGVIAVASNLIGASQRAALSSLMFSCVKLLSLIALVALLPLCLMPDGLIGLFHLEFTSSHQADFIIKECIWTLRFVWLYLVLDSGVWVIAGILTAAGDTRFIMWTNGLSVWLAGVLPCYVWVVLCQGSPSSFWAVVNFYAAINIIFFIWRYHSGHWLKLDLAEPKS